MGRGIEMNLRFCQVFQLMLLWLKLTEELNDWSWWWIWSPTITGFLILALLRIIVGSEEFERICMLSTGAIKQESK